MSIQWKPRDQWLREQLDNTQNQLQWPTQEDTSFRAQQPWELPRQWGEQAMTGVGQAISHVPLLPKALQFVTPAFEWVTENLEKPWASIITAPFSPSLPYQQGESWLAHQKREYESWKAPTYVKGLAEFAMPLWWMPWLGWAGKGAKALGVTNKMGEALSKLGEVAGKVRLPSSEVLDNTLFKQDFFKTVSLWSENKPVLGGITRVIGGPSAFVKMPGVEETALDITKRALVKRSVINDMRNGVRSLLAPKLQKYGDPIKVLDIAPDGLVRSATALDGSSTYLSDLIEGYAKNPDNYKFVSPQSKQFVKETVGIINDVRELAAKEGVNVPKDFTFHRMVKGVETETKGVYETSEWGSKFDVARHRETMKAGALGENGQRIVQYENNPITVVNATIDNYMRKIANKRFNDEIGGLGKTWQEIFSAKEPELAQQIAELSAKKTSATYALNAVNSIITRKGTTLPGATVAKIRKGLPDVAEQLDQAFSFTPEATDKIISRMGKEIWKEAKITPKEFKIVLSQFTKTKGKIMMGELDDAIHALNVGNKTAITAIENAYKEVYLNMSQLQKDSFKAIRTQLDDTLKATKGELSPLLKNRTEWKKSYGEGFGLNLAPWRSNPAFRNQLFPKEVVELGEPAFKDAGNKWLQTMSTTSGVGRTLIAAMDFSAPFIQGLAVLGRNPVAWAKGVIRQFDFFANPEHLYRYMAEPSTLALRAERIAFGGSSQTFEYMEAVPTLQKALGKKLVGSTYGRAEAAYTGFGEIARNEMWKALRNKAVRADGTLDEAVAREVARTIDRMTGVMSTEALGLSRSQRQFENAFLFFAPRYTRASLAYVGDIFKGGISGAEARKSLSALMASGTAMYYGACKVTGQQPNLDINSSQFMTLKVGNQHIGIGGAFYGIARMMANVVGTAANSPADFKSLSVHDNPFLKFMYQRSAPLTGTITNIIENENFIGEPFESPADWGRYALEKITPIALQDVIRGQAEGVSTAAQVFGARTFPQSAWELQEKTKDLIAKREFNKSYVELNDLQKKEISKRPEVSIFQPEIDKRTVQIRDALSTGFLERGRDRDIAKDNFINQLNQLQKAYDDGMISGYDFKEYMQNAKIGYGTSLENIDSNPKYTDVLKRLNQPKDISNDYIGDIAYDELQSASYSGQFDDAYGIFDFDKYNQFRDQLHQKYGDEVWNYVLQRESQGDKDLPPMAQQYEQAKTILKPYWDIQQQVEQRFGRKLEDMPPLMQKNANKIITRMRDILKIRNPQIAQAIEMFYSRG